MDIRLPSLGEGADSGVVVNILVKEGDQVQKDQPVLELETDKAVGSIPSSAAGVVQKVRVAVGDKISAGTVILSLGDAAGAPAAPAAKAPAPGRAAAPTPRAVPAPAAAATAAPKSVPGVPPPASPTVRKIIAQLGIDLSAVQGTESGGRISLDDVRHYIEQLQALAQQPPAAGEEPRKRTPDRIDFGQFGPILKRPMSPLRKTIVRRMGESWETVPRVTQFDEADITALNDLRKKHAPAYEAKGAKLTLTVFAIKAVVDTLKKHGIFNSSLDQVAEEIVLKEYFHVGIAVDTEQGLIVPVIRDADKKTLLQIAKELEDLAGKARERKLSGDQLKGGSFTISNQGGIGGGAFTPIVNTPEVAILGLGRGAMKAVVVGGKIEPRLMLPLAISYDHRVIDGGVAARFTVDLVAAFQNFNEKAVKLE
jgi:pyruvate dehydrogenase E2 component (dihydrolipoamide acetyltransferase)